MSLLRDRLTARIKEIEQDLEALRKNPALSKTLTPSDLEDELSAAKQKLANLPS
jgi:hypothetical protein